MNHPLAPVSLESIRVMVEGSAEERSLVRRAVEEGGKADLEGVVAAIHRVGALDYTRERAREEAAAATARLDRLPDSPCRDSLLQLAHFSVERKF
jgi:octaprenyl-diphosphate synthase